MSASPSPLAHIAAVCEAEGLTIQNGEKIAAIPQLPTYHQGSERRCPLESFGG